MPPPGPARTYPQAVRAHVVVPLAVSAVAIAAGTAVAAGFLPDERGPVAEEPPPAVTLSQPELDELSNLEGDAYVRRSMDLPDTVVTGGGGALPAADEQAPGGTDPSSDPPVDVGP